MADGVVDGTAFAIDASLVAPTPKRQHPIDL
jgi:hypothetical protein